MALFQKWRFNIVRDQDDPRAVGQSGYRINIFRRDRFRLEHYGQPLGNLFLDFFRKGQRMIHDYHRTLDKGHGRIEIRECWVVADPLAFEHIRHYDGWADLPSIIRVRRERRLQGKVEQETVYSISSLAPNAEQILYATRTHWAVENSLHWVLDVTFREDESKGSLKQKRYRAALDDDFLLQLLLQV